MILYQYYFITLEQSKVQAAYWETSAQKNLKASEILLKNKHYDGCLFFAHLALEKIIKAGFIKRKKKYAPKIHDLPKLCALASIPLSKEKRKHLRTFTTFNIAGRYSDEKLSFYKQATKVYTTKYLKLSKELFVWLKDEYQKK